MWREKLYAQPAFTCSKSTMSLIITTLKRRDLRHSGVLNVNFEQTSHTVLVFPLLPLKK